MAKIYKPVLVSVIIFLVVLLMHFARIGTIEFAHVLTLGMLYAAGIVVGALSETLEIQ